MDQDLRTRREAYERCAKLIMKLVKEIDEELSKEGEQKKAA